MSVIIDTCVWSRFLRRKPIGVQIRLGEEVARLIRSDAVQLLGPIRQELLSGAQPDERFEQLREYLHFYPNLPLDEEDDERAASYYNLCRQRGVQGTANRFAHLCPVFCRHGLKVFPTDTDFESVRGLPSSQLHQRETETNRLGPLPQQQGSFGLVVHPLGCSATKTP